MRTRTGREYTKLENTLYTSTLLFLVWAGVALWKHNFISCLCFLAVTFCLGTWAVAEGQKPINIWKRRVINFSLAFLFTCIGLTQFTVLKSNNSTSAATRKNSNTVDSVSSNTPPLPEVKKANTAPKQAKKDDKEWQEFEAYNEQLLREADGVRSLKEHFEKECLSHYDGSCTMLEIAIKNRMNDPDSYEHIDTQYRIEGKYIIVYTQFRGTNAYGAKVINSVTAKVDANCNVLSIGK